MTAEAARRFHVVDLGTQVGEQRRFAVWDATVSRFWKINNRQTWMYVDELIDDFKERFPDQEKFQEVFVSQRDQIAGQAFAMGFVRDDDCPVEAAQVSREQLVAAVVTAGKRWWPSVRSKANHARMTTTELRLWQALRALMKRDGDAC